MTPSNLYAYWNSIIEGLVDRWCSPTLFRDLSECRMAVYRMLREKAERKAKGEA